MKVWWAKPPFCLKALATPSTGRSQGHVPDMPLGAPEGVSCPLELELSLELALSLVSAQQAVAAGFEGGSVL